MLEQAIRQLLAVAQDLSPYQKKTIEKQCRLIASHVKWQNERIEGLSEQLNGSQRGKFYSDLNQLSSLMRLHGYNSLLEVDVIFKDDFLIWFNNNVKKTTKYKASEITRTMLERFSVGFYLFQMDNEREPNSYNELREYILKTNV